MDLRVVSQNKPPIKISEESKQKKEWGNRRPLQEIGNLVDCPHAPIIKYTVSLSHVPIGSLGSGTGRANSVDRKPGNWITWFRNLGALSLADDHTEAEKNKDKRQGERKVTHKPDPQTVIIISSDDDDEEKEITEEFNKRKILSKNRSNKTKNKKIHSLTSVLTARSKVACGLGDKPREELVNIDAIDTDNELAVVEYVEEIYKFYKVSEEENPIFDYMGTQTQINGAMRMILVDWLVEVHKKFELFPETLYLTINVVDRYLSRKDVSRRAFQLIGIGSMLLACKYEEVWAPEVNDFIGISDYAYTKEQILAIEEAILEKLEWNLTVATPYVFLGRFIKAVVPSDKKIENMAFYLAENGMMHYQIVVSFCSSIIAASSVYVAMHTLNKTPVWTETLKHYTGYCEEQLKECAKMLVRFQMAAKDSKYTAIYRKFTSANRNAVALFPPAKHLLDC